MVLKVVQQLFLIDNIKRLSQSIAVRPQRRNEKSFRRWHTDYWFTNLDMSKRHEDLILYRTYTR
jgi:hypothetical protein